jgi:hypothetical protein
MTILSTEILPRTLMLFRLARHPRRRNCFDGAPSRRAVPAHGIKLDVLTNGKQALLTPPRRSHRAMFWRQIIHIYVELIFGCDNFK